MTYVRHRSRWLTGLAIALAIGTLGAPAFALTPSDPRPDPSSPDQNIFYGDVPPNSERAPVIVFVHGLHGTASDWWATNNMYDLAFNSRYRTAFVSLSRDNTPNDAGIDDNALVLRDALPAIAAHYNVSQMYLVGHSKGGVDIQAALLYPEVRPLAKAVITISSPNTGTELAEWAFGPGLELARQLNLLTPGVYSMRTDNMARFRQMADPVLRRAGIPFYTTAGEDPSGNGVTEITGAILQSLAPGKNDGLVPVSRTRLPEDYSAALEDIQTNHFLADNGVYSWSKIAARIQGLEYTLAEFNRVISNGFEDNSNNFIWSMGWFKGQLYVGTGRQVQCSSVRTADILSGKHLYDVSLANGQCPPLPQLHRSLNAEIWRHTPQTGRWERVYRSPSSIFAGFDEQGALFTARDVGFRGMTIVTDAQGNEELYVGGVTSGSLFDYMPMFANGFPPPRLLHTANGTDWVAVPQAPGTLMGEIAKPLPGSTRKQRSFRALTAYRGMLFATVADYRGVGFVVASANPAAGNNAWFRVTPIPEEFPVWNLTVFNNLLYATTGDMEISDVGYGLYKTAASGPLPFTWTPVITNGGYQPDARVRSGSGLSFMEFKGQLYLGMNRPTELVRVRPDDTWDLLVGEPRMTPQGYKAPLTGMGIGFGSWFNGHFWRMAAHNGRLYLGTWDWSIGMRTLDNLEKMFGAQFGFDLYRTDDGVHWTAVSRSGMGQPLNFGGRSFQSTPFGLFFGTARPMDGAHIFQCKDPDCTPEAGVLPAPTRLQAVSETLSGRQAILSWDPVPGAVRYRIYRMTAVSVPDILKLDTPLTAPDGAALTARDLRDGALNWYCAIQPDDALCGVADALRADAVDSSVLPFVTQFLFPAVQVGIRQSLLFSETAPTAMQSVYFVRAEDAEGNLSPPSNFVGGPSKASFLVNPLP